MILENETKKDEVTLNSETFIVTNKRIIYSSPNNNTFIGLSELRGAELAKQKISINRINLPEINKLLPIVVIISMMISYTYICSTDYSMEFGDLTPLFIAIIYSFGVAPILLIIIYSLRAFTSYKKEVLTFVIIKTDGTYWANENYDILFSTTLSQLTNSINDIVYK